MVYSCIGIRISGFTGDRGDLCTGVGHKKIEVGVIAGHCLVVKLEADQCGIWVSFF